MSGGMKVIVSGVLVLVIGIALANPVITMLVTVLSGDAIGSFESASAIGELVPLVYFMVIIGLGLAMIGGGGYSQFKGGM